MNRPWMKFYPTDWRAEPRLRMCSLAARGLWIDLISYMHEGEPYGYLTINGAVPGIDDMAALVSRPVKEVQKAFDELEAKQVFSVDEGSGAMYSRRMVRDHDKSEEGREQIAKRWPNRGPNRSNDKTPITQKLEARKNPLPKGRGASAPSGDQKTEFFRRGREVLGKDSGGVLAKLLRSFGQEDDPRTIAKARARIEEASTKATPVEWIGRVMAPKPGEFKLMSGIEGVI